jgi:hypothetical protein
MLWTGSKSGGRWELRREISLGRSRIVGCRIDGKLVEPLRRRVAHLFFALKRKMGWCLSGSARAGIGAQQDARDA